MPEISDKAGFDAVITAPFGAVGITVANDYVTGIKLIPGPVAPYCAEQPFVQHVVLKVRQYLEDAANPLDIPYLLQGTLFQKRVWQAMAQIPLGQAWTYGELAEHVGSGPRAVANVCGANNLPLLIPCHRIVAKAGIGGFMQGEKQGLEIKRWLLRHEQVDGYR
ncbi:methylated-DNA--[protein]-cysteine S-methyltransferase [Methylobacillus arboreus]|uniref:methylated-DNA--[protein]-cysteine S-methyltransferase n=1 Tax=Methylobacillus arboreus TaxID=755170 RepID=UPI001E5B975A|nr:methylated-DNA--[protein]-cysteine S-methyltransferase [Methylobacillus arboreus]MCB5190535.1 methylated-DNA--[protein]-cysteine S-methyltransferase [Methylobacillus arboreus]